MYFPPSKVIPRNRTVDIKAPGKWGQVCVVLPNSSFHLRVGGSEKLLAVVAEGGSSLSCSWEQCPPLPSPPPPPNNSITQGKETWESEVTHYSIRQQDSGFWLKQITMSSSRFPWHLRGSLRFESGEFSIDREKSATGVMLTQACWLCNSFQHSSHWWWVWLTFYRPYYSRK